jgi:hypothetical protein
MNMKIFVGASARWCAPTLLSVIAFLLAGCARDDRPIFTIEERTMATSPEPPPVLAIPVVAQFTNQAGFGAQCRIEYAPGGNRRPLQGAFLHRGGRFLFAAEAQEKRARGREMTFIWDSTTNEGRALNDALPGYAPILARPVVTSMQSTGRAPAEDKVNGQRCSQEKVTLTLSDGSDWQLTVWRADDLRGLPVRIRSDAGTSRFTIDLTDVRLQEPAPQLFDTPPDFTRYETPKAMFDEMFRRESLTRRELKARPAFDEEEFQRTGRMRPVE